MLLAPKINVIFGISTSNDLEISKLYAKDRQSVCQTQTEYFQSSQGGDLNPNFKFCSKSQMTGHGKAKDHS